MIHELHKDLFAPKDPTSEYKRTLCLKAKKIISISENTKIDLIKIFGIDEKKIQVHYQSCDPAFYKLLESNRIYETKEKYKLSRPYILHVGAFEERKNQLNLLKAYAQISEKIAEDLVFIGQGKKYKEIIRSQINELKLNDRVHLLDSVGFEDLPSLYQGANVFCFPSLFEGFGIPIIEALFSKTPVITSVGSCFPESAGPNSYYIDPLSINSIAEGLISVLTNQNLRIEMSEKGLEFVQRFHLKETTSHLMKIYHNQ